MVQKLTVVIVSALGLMLRAPAARAGDNSVEVSGALFGGMPLRVSYLVENLTTGAFAKASETLAADDVFDVVIAWKERDAGPLFTSSSVGIVALGAGFWTFDRTKRVASPPSTSDRNALNTGDSVAYFYDGVFGLAVEGDHDWPVGGTTLSTGLQLLYIPGAFQVTETDARWPPGSSAPVDLIRHRTEPFRVTVASAVANWEVFRWGTMHLGLGGRVGWVVDTAGALGDEPSPDLKGAGVSASSLEELHTVSGLSWSGDLRIRVPLD